MSSTVIWIPFRGDGGWRDRNFEVAHRQATSLGFPVWVHDSGDQPFSIARTWNELGERDGWDRAILWGADFVLVDPSSVHAALAVDHHWVFAFDRVSTLNAFATRIVHRHGPREFPPSNLPFGGIRVITRSMWETVGGYDSRFLGWGHEDRAHVHCVEMLCGPRRRVPGHMLNLWHPKRRQLPSAAYFARQTKNLELLREYQAITDPGDLRRFLAARA